MLSEETKTVLKSISDLGKLAGAIATAAGQPEAGIALEAGIPFLIAAAQMLGISEVVKVQTTALGGTIDLRSAPVPPLEAPKT